MKTIIGILLSVITFSACSPRLYPDAGWRDRKWVLHEINNTPVQLSGTNRDAHLYFLPGEKRYNGSGGCNRISGVYEIRNNNRIKFNEPTRTKMMCDDQAFEENFLGALNRVDRYSIENDVMLLKDGNIVLMMLK